MSKPYYKTTLIFEFISEKQPTEEEIGFIGQMNSNSIDELGVAVRVVAHSTEEMSEVDKAEFLSEINEDK